MNLICFICIHRARLQCATVCAKIAIMAPRPRYVPVTMFQKANLLKTLLLKVVDLLFNLREVTGAHFFLYVGRVNPEEAHGQIYCSESLADYASVTGLREALDGQVEAHRFQVSNADRVPNPRVDPTTVPRLFIEKVLKDSLCIVKASPKEYPYGETTVDVYKDTQKWYSLLYYRKLSSYSVPDLVTFLIDVCNGNVLSEKLIIAAMCRLMLPVCHFIILRALVMRSCSGKDIDLPTLLLHLPPILHHLPPLLQYLPPLLPHLPPLLFNLPP